MTNDTKGCLTIKLGAGMEAPWLVVDGKDGDERVDWVISFAGLDTEGKTKPQAFVDAVHHLQQMYAGKLIETGLGAKPVTTTGRPKVSTAGRGKARPKAEEAPAKQEANPHAKLLDEINKITEASDLKVFYAKHKAAFTAAQEAGDDRLKFAFNTKRDELTTK
jgi:hypothetical protein